MALADACRRLLNDVTVARRLGLKGREEIATRFTPPHIAKLWEDFLKTIPK
jgi:glycosyltransferase involved in cell wall biosynthesis